MKPDAVIIIPSRIASTRLLNKPLQKIGEKTVIEWVAYQATNANICDVFIACCSEQLSETLKNLGYNVILTDPKIASGSDRVYAAYTKLEKNYKYIINIQGDMPFIKLSTIQAVYNLLKSKDTDIATVATEVDYQKRMADDSVVEAIVANTGKALYFTRAYDRKRQGIALEHIGIYGYTKEALEKFSSLNQSPLEKRERLEQLRALENNMKIYVDIVDDPHISVDTQDDLMRARAYYKELLEKQ